MAVCRRQLEPHTEIFLIVPRAWRRNYTPAQIANRIQDELQSFSGDRPQRDDVTLVVVGVVNPAGVPNRAAAS